MAEKTGVEAPWRPMPLLRASVGLHAAAVATLLAWPAKWPLIGGALVLNHVVVSVAGMLPRCSLLGPNLSRLPAVAGGSRVALTFDDGPDPQVTPRVLDLLDEHAATASFFFIGHRAEAHPEEVAETVCRGHLVENHGWRHANSFAFWGPGAVGRDIDRAQDTMERLSGRRPIFFRAPAGIRSPWLDPVLARRDLRLASWTRRGFDTVERRPDRVSHRLLKGLAAGDILLLHDGSAARDRGGRPVVLEVLPRLLDAIAERGLRATHLPSSS